MTLRLAQRTEHRALTRPAENSRSRWSSREARIIDLTTDGAAFGSGEVAPLPSFSRETLADCELALAALDLSDLPARLEPGQAVLAELARASQRLPRSVPAARAGLEAALLDLWSRAAGVPAWALLFAGSEPPRPRNVAALLQGEPEAALAQARAARGRGITTFKFKVGRADANEREVRALLSLRAELGPGAALRLDANGAWSSDVARATLARFAVCAPEFVEEPCALAELTELGPSPVPLALDESLRDLSEASGSLAPFVRAGLRALVLKPTLLGGITACHAWAMAARDCGVEVILSHAFEGALGLALSATLALAVGSEHAAHGLDLEGARVSPGALPYFAGPRIHPWPTPGFGVTVPGA